MDLYEIDENGYILEPEEIDITPESSYFIVLTTDVLYDKRLNDFQKILFGAVSGLCRKRGYCWAPNSHFEKELNKSESVVSQGISKLVELGYLNREIILKKKYDKDGKIIQTKQVAFRKLTVTLNNVKKVDDGRGMPENEYTPMPENEQQINNNIINNLSISKDIDEAKTSSDIEEDKELKNNNINENIDGDVLVKDDQCSQTPAAPRKGLAPLIEIVRERYDEKKDPELVTDLLTYLKAHIGCRKLPSEEKWKRMLNDLELYSTINLPGATGSKFIKSRALEIIQKAIIGKNGAPFLEFDNIYNVQKSNVMEPQFNLNQEFNKGY